MGGGKRGDGKGRKGAITNCTSAASEPHKPAAADAVAAVAAYLCVTLSQSRASVGYRVDQKKKERDKPTIN